MKLASVRIVTNDIDGLIAFYTTLTGASAARLAEDFAEIRLAGAILAISTERAVKQFNAGAAIAAANRSAIVEFQVEDVDAVHGRLNGEQIDWVMMPTTQPWGNRSMLLRDPDGNLINIFTRLTRNE
jgi:catechol 2,3-dioxygenase-like lactoylglutathione lyase family enzyme